MTMPKFPCTIFLVLFSASVFVSCKDHFDTVHEQVIQVDTSNLRDDTLMMDNSLSHSFSRLKKSNSFGRVYTYKYPDALIGKELLLVFEGKMRTNYAESNSTISLAVHEKEGGQLNWMSIFLRRHFTDINTWCRFKDSIRIDPKYIGKKSATVTCMLYLANSNKENFDFDSLKVKIKVKK